MNKNSIFRKTLFITFGVIFFISFSFLLMYERGIDNFLFIPSIGLSLFLGLLVAKPFYLYKKAGGQITYIYSFCS